MTHWRLTRREARWRVYGAPQRLSRGYLHSMMFPRMEHSPLVTMTTAMMSNGLLHLLQAIARTRPVHLL